MATTNFVSGTVVESSWLNDVDDGIYRKLAETVSVKDFGATGDGTTDDTAAIQLAIDYAAAFSSVYGLTVEFPRGDYLYSALTISTSQIHLFSKHDARLIKSGTTGDGITIKSTGARIYGVKVSLLPLERRCK
jgi:polygalacturonase